MLIGPLMRGQRRSRPSPLAPIVAACIAFAIWLLLSGRIFCRFHQFIKSGLGNGKNATHVAMKP